MISPPKVFPALGVRLFCIVLGCVLCPPFFAGAQQAGAAQVFLWGTDAGLYSRDGAGRVNILWSGGKVQRIIPWSQNQEAASPQSPGAPISGVPHSGWALLTDQGILVSENLKDWEQRCQGLPERVIKIYEDGKKSFVTTVQEIKALAVDPGNPGNMVCAVKDAVYLSKNGGMHWEKLGMPNFKSNGIKAVAVASLPGSGGTDITVFCSHSIYGVYYINPGKAGAKWIEINAGLEDLETTGNPDEISDFAVTMDHEFYAAQTFRRRVYKLDWEHKSWVLLWSGGSSFGSSDSLAPGKDSLCFVRDGGILELGPLSSDKAAPPDLLKETERKDLTALVKAIPGNYKPNCVVLRLPRKNATPPKQPLQESDLISLSELWLLWEQSSLEQSSVEQRSVEQRSVEQSSVERSSVKQSSVKQSSAEGTPGKAKAEVAAAGKEGLYLPVNYALDEKSLKPYLDIIEKRSLNMVVIDMKDDYGRLRFTPRSPSLTDNGKNLGRVFRPVDIDAFLKTMKERGVYTVARIVVFKDPEAARKDGAKYAVWDGKYNKPWEGYYDTRRKKTPPGQTPPETNPALVSTVLPGDDPDYEILRTWYDEKWVDPYSEDIWDYNASVAEELVSRGFDEIQFDYIRFPTDGYNLGDARFRWRENNMDMDSAIISFLRHVRSRIKAPISVDIYGANGWYRTGARTGQEVELLAPWVDVICPMYYPSHFEQDFLAQAPPELRPYRIYNQGTQRTRYIARGRVVVRPWAQAFYLNVSYDKKYYGPDYVRLELEGVRDAGSGGLTYWNNGGRYADIPVKP